MDDITMCEGLHCPKRKECYRYTALVNSLYQSYAGFYENMAINGVCADFWNNENRIEVKE
jgi:hypothetical protein